MQTEGLVRLQRCGLQQRADVRAGRLERRRRRLLLCQQHLRVVVLHGRRAGVRAQEAGHGRRLDQHQLHVLPATHGRAVWRRVLRRRDEHLQHRH
jgi:hypothetical protein